MEWGNTGKGREMTRKIGGEGSIEKKRASFTAGLMQVVNNSKFDLKKPREPTLLMWFLDSVWIKLSNEGSPFPGSGIVK